MRDGQTWPVIFSTGYNNPGTVDAYSLYPVANPQYSPPMQTYWHQIGSNLLHSQNTGAILSAATSSDGRVGAVVRDRFNNNDLYNLAVVGSSSSGFGSTMSGVKAIDFSSTGTLIKGTMNTIPGWLAPSTLVDIAVSPMGDLGAIDKGGYYYQKIAWTGQWGAQTYLDLPDSPSHADLAMDSLGRPHVVSTLNTGDGPFLVASDFDLINEQWTSQTLNTFPVSTYLGATVAADSLGGVGAAWVENEGTYGALKYAYSDGSGGWNVSEVTTGVYNSLTMNYENLPPDQRVGLAFDANDFPVISFVAEGGYGSSIWLAYDPVAVPEPSTLLLAASGVLMLLVAGKSRLRRLLDK